MSDPLTLAKDYIELQKTIAELELRCKVIKDAIADEFPPTLVPSTVTGGGVVVQWVKGRRSEKVDQKKVRMGLALSGVDLSVIEDAYSRATTVTEGQPHLRISQGDAAREEE